MKKNIFYWRNWKYNRTCLHSVNTATYINLDGNVWLPSLCHILVIHICLWNKQVVTFDDLIATFIPSFHTCSTTEQKVTNFKQLFKPQGVREGGYSQKFWLGVCRPHRSETNENWDPTEGPNLENETQIKRKKKIRIKENTCKKLPWIAVLIPWGKVQF